MEMRDVQERRTVSIRMTVPVERLPEVMGKSFWEIMEYLNREGIPPAGPPFGYYHNMDMANLDVEMGFPVREELPGDGRVKASTLPAGRVAVETHRGPYETMEETYNKVIGELKERGLEMDEFMYEFYLNDPDEVSPEEIETEIYMPVKG